MISNQWDKFNNFITIKDKSVSEYEDEEGNYAILPTGNLLCGVQYNELTEEQLKVAIFEGKIPKDMKLKTKERKKVITKDKKTGNKEDRFTLIEDGKELIYQVWFIVDGMKNTTAFNDKDEAIAKAKEQNKKVLEIVNKDNNIIVELLTKILQIIKGNKQ